jgi:tRNA(fMet)-specific endonuclease VapC
MNYLLDTNTVSDLVRNPQGMIAIRIAQVGEQRVCTSIIAAAELRFGAAKRGSLRLTKQLDRVLAALPILPFEVPAEIVYGDVRARLEAQGIPIGGNDMLIAAHALSLGMTVVTDNVREFSRVENLAVANWLRPE